MYNWHPMSAEIKFTPAQDRAIAEAIGILLADGWTVERDTTDYGNTVVLVAHRHHYHHTIALAGEFIGGWLVPGGIDAWKPESLVRLANWIVADHRDEDGES